MKKVLLSAAGFLGFSLIPVAASVFFRYERALLSLDTILLFLAFAYKKKTVGRFFLIVFILVEALYGFRKVYPLFNLGTLIEVIPFVRFANPTLVALGVIAFLAFLLVCCLSARFIVRNSSATAILILLLPIGVLANIPPLTNFDPWQTSRVRILGEPLLGSTSYDLFFMWRADVSGWTTHNDGENFYPLRTVSAASSIWPSGALPKKVLFVVVESWGRPTNELEYEIQTQGFTSNKNIEILREGVIDYEGGTVQAELRELCAITPISYAFSHIPANFATRCLPFKLSSQGYRTVALHAAHSGMYARDAWYPIIGFEESYFYNKPLVEVRKCKSFPGFCDVELIPSVISKIGREEKIFFYWMTLNSHMPYDPADLSSKDDSVCRRLDILNSSRCHQFLLVKDLFDHLGVELSSPGLEGIEVVLVGDHNPPFITFMPDMDRALGVLKTESYEFDKQFIANKVPYLHLRVRGG